MTVTIYGIKNCNTMKKAMNWLDEQQVNYEFHDYKKFPVDENVVKLAIAQHGYETVINRKGMTWRNLDEDIKNALDAEKALQLAADKPSIIKRPLLVIQDDVYLGFDENNYAQLFS